jgi:hypothetical protein
VAEGGLSGLGLTGEAGASAESSSPMKKARIVNELTGFKRNCFAYAPYVDMLRLSRAPQFCNPGRGDSRAWPASLRDPHAKVLWHGVEDVCTIRS